MLAHLKKKYYPGFMWGQFFQKTNVGISLPRRRCWNPGNNLVHFSFLQQQCLSTSFLIQPASLLILLNLFHFLTEISPERKGIWTPKRNVKDTEVFLGLEFVSSQTMRSPYHVAPWALSLNTGRIRTDQTSNCLLKTQQVMGFLTKT